VIFSKEARRRAALGCLLLRCLGRELREGGSAVVGEGAVEEILRHRRHVAEVGEFVARVGLAVFGAEVRYHLAGEVVSEVADVGQALDLEGKVR